MPSLASNKPSISCYNQKFTQRSGKKTGPERDQNKTAVQQGKERLWQGEQHYLKRI